MAKYKSTQEEKIFYQAAYSQLSNPRNRKSSINGELIGLES
jgi:hypothetical protein